MSPPACHSYGMTCFSRILLVGLYCLGTIWWMRTDFKTD